MIGARESPDEEIVGDELHLLCVEDAVQTAGSTAVWKISHSNADHHLLEIQHGAGQRQRRLF